MHLKMKLIFRICWNMKSRSQAVENKNRNDKLREVVNVEICHFYYLYFFLVYYT